MKFLATTALAVLLATPVVSEEERRTNCADTADVHDILAGNYKEQRLGFGLTERGVLAEFWANLETGSWTVLYTTPGDTQTCVVAQGVGWSPIVPVAAGEPA
jgi:hypothetical protein